MSNISHMNMGILTNLWLWISSSASGRTAGEQVPTCSILLRFRLARGEAGAVFAAPLELWLCHTSSP